MADEKETPAKRLARLLKEMKDADGEAQRGRTPTAPNPDLPSTPTTPDRSGEPPLNNKNKRGN
jgi:hypothetical protein